MPAGRPQFTMEKSYNGETYEQIYAQELKPVSMEEFEAMSDEERKLAKPYPFNPRTYEAAPGIICEQDAAVPMRDGVVLYADIYRPADTGEKVPAILAWSNYGKRPNEFRPKELAGFTPGVPQGTISEMAKFEAADPAFWCPNGYAVINVDIRGIGFSGGYHDQFGHQDGEDGYDFIEWVAEQPWSNGKVAMAGSSALAISQYQIAAQQPPHLAAIAPWEGMSDMYRESLNEGGIPCVKFTDFATAGAAGLLGIDDQGAMALKYPLMGPYWKDKIADWSKIEVPMYACVGWNHFHMRGTIMAWRGASSKNKWLRAHREFEWPDFYAPENMQELKLFFDRYCKGINNGWEMTPRVRIAVQDAFDQDWEKSRPENEFPLARTVYKKLYLDASKEGVEGIEQGLAVPALPSPEVMAAMTEPPKPPMMPPVTKRGLAMSESPVDAEASAIYDPSGTDTAQFDFTFDKDIEITGYLKLHIWVEAPEYNDMDLFITVKKLSTEGVEQPITFFGGTAPHPGAWGKMRVSHRALDKEMSTDFQPIQSHEKLEKLEPGQIVPVDIEINPTSRIWHAGETLRVQIAGNYLRDPHWIEPLVFEADNKGPHVIHTGGKYDSYLQIPVIPPKYDSSTVFAIDAAAHPSNPIF